MEDSEIGGDGGLCYRRAWRNVRKEELEYWEM